MSPEMILVDLADAAANKEILLPFMKIKAGNCLVYSNHHFINPGWAGEQYFETYKRRIVEVDPVYLVRLDKDYVVASHDYDTFLIHDAGKVVAEQTPPWLRSLDKATFEKIFDAASEEIYLDDEVVVAARFGLTTWGHWLGELLPKIVSVEAAYPNRYKYLLPHETIESHQPRNVWVAISESLAFYGITADRIIPAHHRTTYRMRGMYAVTSVWQDRSFHPAALELMRHRPWLMVSPDEEVAPKTRISLLRSDAAMRTITNSSEVETTLNSAGFVTVKPAELPFAAQVDLFRRADCVAGILGSGFSGLIYAKENVQVLSMCPHNWGDNFFYAMAQDRHATFVDLRGNVDPAMEADTQAGRGQFEINMEHLERALRILQASPPWSDT